MKNCPCQSNLDYSVCCEPYLNGTQHAKTPEALMRSRYAAFTLARTDYIMKTMRGKAAQYFDARSVQQWAQSVEWLGLTVIDAPEGTDSDTQGTVEFIARFSENGVQKHIHERSNFERIDGQWFYTDGTTPKVNRNDPCPCASGKKAKKCCFF